MILKSNFHIKFLIFKIDLYKLKMNIFSYIIIKIIYHIWLLIDKIDQLLIINNF